MPPWTAPPFINPSVANGTNVAWFQGNETTKLPAYDNFNFSIQRQLSSSMVLEGAYNGVMGEHLQAQLLQYNSLPVADTDQVRHRCAQHQRAEQPGRVRHRQCGRRFAPFPGFNALWGSRATVAQALRPFPQYTDIDTYSGQGDHSGHSTYHACPVEVPEALSLGLTLQSSYVFSKILTDADTAWGERLCRRPVQPRAGEIDRPVRRHARFQVRRGLRSALRQRQPVPHPRSRGLGPGQLARLQHQYLRQRHAGRHQHVLRAAGVRQRLRRPRGALH